MAAKKGATTASFTRISHKKKRPGVHAKKKRSVHKGNKNWEKPYKGQGR